MTDSRAALTPAPAGAVPPTAPAGAGTLAFAIQAWHAAHPDFVAVLPCVAPVAVVWATRPDVGWMQAASRLGIPIAEYRQRRERGERWCSHCRDWHPSTVPFNGNSSVCQRYWQDYRAARKRRAS